MGFYRDLIRYLVPSKEDDPLAGLNEDRKEMVKEYAESESAKAGVKLSLADARKRLGL